MIQRKIYEGARSYYDPNKEFEKLWKYEKQFHFRVYSIHFTSRLQDQFSPYLISNSICLLFLFFIKRIFYFDNM